MIFVNLIYRHFDIFMSQYAQMNKKLCNSGLRQDGVLAPYCKDWEPGYPPNPSDRLRLPWIPLRYTQTPLRHPPDTTHTSPVNTKYQQTTTSTNRHRQTYSNSTSQRARVSGGVCWHLLSSNGILSSLEMSGGVWRMSGGCLGVSEWNSWKSEALGFVWGVSGFSVLAVWSQSTILA